MKSMQQIKQEQKEALDKLVEFAGGQSRLARGLGTSPQTVYGWVVRGRISAFMAIVAEEETNGYITKEELRPDVDTWYKDAI